MLHEEKYEMEKLQILILVYSIIEILSHEFESRS